MQDVKLTCKTVLHIGGLKLTFKKMKVIQQGNYKRLKTFPGCLFSPCVRDPGLESKLLAREKRAFSFCACVSLLGLP